MKAKNILNNVECIRWIDSCQASGWTEICDALIKPAICYSVGFIIEETEDYILICGNFSPKSDDKVSIDSVCGQMVIPKYCIVHRAKLGIPEYLLESK
jgi:hypothetical protein